MNDERLPQPSTRSDPPSHILTRWLFLRFLGLIYLIAFASLAGQVNGLIGSNGILPVSQFLEAARSNYGANAYHYFPTLSWLNPGDAFLQLLCIGGMIAALLVIMGLLTAPSLVVCWLFYLSLTIDGQIFLGYQWDGLLLEVGVLAILFAPFQIIPRLSKQVEPSRAGLWLLRFLLFRLMFSSGIAKLASGDATWANLTALTYHYYTQPLPTPIAWYAHQLPLWFHQLSAAVMFIIEVFVPFLIFVPIRRVRLMAAGGLIFLQVLILLTGNYTFFNWLAIALCLTLVDDTFLRRWLPMQLTDAATADKSLPRWREWIVALVSVPLFFLGGLQVIGLFSGLEGIPAPALQLLITTSPFRLVNRYGLFAVMTTSRLEIEMEGSNDGENWKAYSFFYKPGDVKRPPPWIEPLQPRLDWQMWFAALGSARQIPGSRIS